MNSPEPSDRLDNKCSDIVPRTMRPLRRLERLVRSIILGSLQRLQRRASSTGVQTAPSPQRTLDIFKGEWASVLPPPFSDLEAGPVPLFTDNRLEWAAEHLGPFRDKTVLELGPLEGGHSWMMANMGAASGTAVEANIRAFLKCLIVKDLLNTPRTRFLCGDFIAYLEEQQPRYDIVVASGVLYHMRDPVHLIDLITRTADRVYLWTHYFDPEECGAVGSARFPSATETESHGFKHTLYVTTPASSSTREILWRRHDFHQLASHAARSIGALRHFGFQQIETAFEQRDHQAGPAFAVVGLGGSRF